MAKGRGKKSKVSKSSRSRVTKKSVKKSAKMKTPAKKKYMRQTAAFAPQKMTYTAIINSYPEQAKQLSSVLDKYENNVTSRLTSGDSTVIKFNNEVTAAKVKSNLPNGVIAEVNNNSNSLTLYHKDHEANQAAQQAIMDVQRAQAEATAKIQEKKSQIVSATEGMKDEQKTYIQDASFNRWQSHVNKIDDITVNGSTIEVKLPSAAMANSEKNLLARHEINSVTIKDGNILVVEAKAGEKPFIEQAGKEAAAAEKPVGQKSRAQQIKEENETLARDVGLDTTGLHRGN